MSMRELWAGVVSLGLVLPAMGSNLEVYLPLNGNLQDASGNGRNGTLVDGSTGTNSYITTSYGQGLDLGLTNESKSNLESQMTDGDYVSINYKLPETGTIALWYKTASLDYNYQSVWDNSAGADVWECWIDNWGPGDLYARSPSSPPANWGDADNRAVQYNLGANHYDQWTHITVSWAKNGSNMEMKMYVNGNLVDTAPNMIWMDAGDQFYLGGGNDGNTYSIGAFDELAIWSTQLSDSEVANVYANGVPEPTTIGLLLMGLAGLLRRK